MLFAIFGFENRLDSRFTCAKVQNRVFSSQDIVNIDKSIGSIISINNKQLLFSIYISLFLSILNVTCICLSVSRQLPSVWGAIKTSNPFSVFQMWQLSFAKFSLTSKNFRCLPISKWMNNFFGSKNKQTAHWNVRVKSKIRAS